MGKSVSSKNSYKTGYYSCSRRELRARGRALIRANTEFCHILRARHLQKTQKPAKRTEFGEDVLPFSPLHFLPEPPKYRPYFNSQRLRR